MVESFAPSRLGIMPYDSAPGGDGALGKSQPEANGSSGRQRLW